MSTNGLFFEAFERECVRLGLDWRDLPGLAIADGPDGEAQFLAHLRQLEPGVTWHTVFPSMPAHWIPGEPDTWTWPYSPLGAFDHQELPAGPAIMVGWEESTDRACLTPLVESARSAGFEIFGADFTPHMVGASILAAYIVLNRGVSEARATELCDWLQDRGDVVVLDMVRTGSETYPPS